MVAAANRQPQVADDSQQFEDFKQQVFNQIPKFVPNDDREALADSRARIELRGAEPTDDYTALVERSAEAIEQGYQESYQTAGVDEGTAAIAATGQRKQFLGEALSEPESSSIQIGENALTEQRKEYGRTINALQEQYTSDLGRTGDTSLTNAAAKIRAGQQIYGNEPTEKQEKLLKAADIQRQNGVSRQISAAYKSAGVSADLAKSAGSIKAQQYISDTEPSDAQQRRVSQADTITTSPEGQLKVAERQQFLQQQRNRSYEEGKIVGTLEARGVESGLASKAAKIQVSSAGDPAPEDVETLKTAYATAGLSERDAEIATNAERFMDTASQAGKTVQFGNTEVAQGQNYAISRTAGVTVVENTQTGGAIAARDGDVLSSEGMTADDQERFQRLGQVSAQQLQQATQPKPSKPSQGAELD